MVPAWHGDHAGALFVCEAGRDRVNLESPQQKIGVCVRVRFCESVFCACLTSTIQAAGSFTHSRLVIIPRWL